MSEIKLPVCRVERCGKILEMLKVIYKAEKTETHYIVQRDDLDRLKNERGETLLFVAVKTANVEILKLLIEAGADVNAQDESGQTPLMRALKNLNIHEELGFRMMIKILYEANANIYTADKRGKSPVQFIANDLNVTYGDSFVHDFFLDIISRECGGDSETIAKKLIDVNYPLWGAVHLRKAEVIEHMILLGCPVDSCHPKRRFTALHEAVGLIDLEIVKVLIKHDANPDVIDSQVCLPIDYLYTDNSDNSRQLEITKILLTKTSIQPEHLLAFQYARKVFEYGTREMVRMMLERVGVENPIDRDRGMFPLHYLVQNRHSDVIEELRGRQINFNARCNSGRTPLHFAAKSSHCHINTFRFLLENGADPTARDKYNNTPLLILHMNDSITKEKYLEIAEILLLYGLDFRLVDPMTILGIIENNLRPFYKAKPILKHLAMLDEMKKPISERIRNKINIHPKFKIYFDVFKAELAELKNHVIDKELTLYAIVTDQMDDEKILKDCKFSPSLLSKFEKSKEELQSNNYYHTVIKKRISTIISKLEVLQKASSVMCKLLKLVNDPYHIIVTKIMSYLNTEDHQTLVELDI